MQTALLLIRISATACAKTKKKSKAYCRPGYALSQWSLSLFILFDLPCIAPSRFSQHLNSWHHEGFPDCWWKVEIILGQLLSKCLPKSVCCLLVIPSDSPDGWSQPVSWGLILPSTMVVFLLGGCKMNEMSQMIFSNHKTFTSDVGTPFNWK